jgi:hypothetical protein
LTCRPHGFVRASFRDLSLLVLAVERREGEERVIERIELQAKVHGMTENTEVLEGRRRLAPRLRRTTGENAPCHVVDLRLSLLPSCSLTLLRAFTREGVCETTCYNDTNAGIISLLLDPGQ